MQFYQFHIGDYIGATAHLDPMEDLAYRRLIDLYYQTESPLPNDMRTLCKRIRLASESHCVESVFNEFFTLSDDGQSWHHERCDAELNEIYEKSQKARESAQKRWKKQANLSGNDANAMPTQCERIQNASNSHTNSHTNSQCEGNATHDPLPITHIPPHKNHEEVGDKSPLAPKKFSKPSVDEVTEHMKTKISDPKAAIVEADKFWNYYESNGWRVGKNPMKNWMAACNQWVARGFSDAQARASPTQSKHTGFNERDYGAGIRADGSF